MQFVEKADANGIFMALAKSLSDIDVSPTADGASVNTGEANGVIAKMPLGQRRIQDFCLGGATRPISPGRFSEKFRRKKHLPKVWGGAMAPWPPWLRDCTREPIVDHTI